MTRVLFSVHAGDSIAHILRTRSVARDLSLRGHEVFYSIPPSRSHYLSDYIDPHRLVTSAQRYSFAAIGDEAAFEEAFRKHVCLESEWVARYSPDFIIGDTGAIVHAYASHLPFLRIVDRFYVEIGIDELRSPYAPEQKRALREQVEGIIQRARRAVGIEKRFRYAEFIAPPVGVDGASFMVDDVPSSYRRIGSNITLRCPGPAPDRDPRICFFTLGTGLDAGRAPLFHEILARIEKRFERIYVAYGTQLREEELRFPDNVVAQRRFESVPPGVGVMICQCGTGVMHLGIRMGVPVIAVPLHVEQFSNAWHLERLGCGVNVTTVRESEFRGILTRPEIDWDKLSLSLNTLEQVRSRFDVIDTMPVDGSLFRLCVEEFIGDRQLVRCS